MLLDFREVCRRQSVNVTGVCHIGAHLAEEAEVYGQVPVTFVEANPDLIPAITDKLRAFPHQRVVQACVSDRIGEAEFHVTNNGQSSSLLPFGTHATHHPEVTVTRTVMLPTTTLDLLAAQNRIVGNVLNMDIQGAEGLVIAGAPRFLEQIDLILCEVNMEDVYEGNVQFDDLRAMLPDFQLRELIMTRFGWGDCAMVRVL